MSRQINQPSNQIKLTNVSLIRLRRGKRRFEIACYKNKVLEWRSGIETDLDNVLQIRNVFLNVSKGQTAPREDLDKAFGAGRPLDDIVLEILTKGDLQVGERERAAQLERVRNEVVDLVAARLVDPRTKRVYTHGMIEKALDMLSQQAHATTQSHAATTQNHAATTQNHAAKTDKHSSNDAATEEGAEGADAPAPAPTPAPATAAAPEPKPTWTGVATGRNAKSQALEAIRALIAHQPIPVERARMRLRVTCPTGVLKQVVKGAAAAPKGSRDGGDEPDGAEHHRASGTVKDRILSYIEQVDGQDVVGDQWEVVGFVEPGAFKGLSDFIAADTRGRGRVEVLDVALTHEDE